MKTVTCSVQICNDPVRFCDLPAHRRGWCSKHYGRYCRTGDPLGTIGSPHDESLEQRIARASVFVDGTDGCLVPKGSRNMGWRGKTRALRQWSWICAFGPIPDGLKISRANICGTSKCVNAAHLLLTDGWYLDPINGYVLNGYHKAQHRVVMEQAIGRELLPGETVHHRNGMRDDNRLSNLQLKPSNHGQGQSIPDLLEWADEIIERYRGMSDEPYAQDG